MKKKIKLRKEQKEQENNYLLLLENQHYGCEIKEKPDKEFYDITIKQMGKFLRTLSELERLLYHKKFIDERKLKNEIIEWRKFRMEIKERFL